MKRIIKYLDEISNKEFSTEKQAKKSEERHKDIKKAFAFMVTPDSCVFGNGEFSIKRDKDFRDKALNVLVKLINKYELWITKKYKTDGLKLTKDNVLSYYVGRCLDDNFSPLYEWRNRIDNICPVCYQQWGQCYFKNNCNHIITNKKGGE